MERVIVLSKFKAFLNRIFVGSEDPEDSHVKEEHESNDGQQEQEQEKQQEKQQGKPTFRFPIITDAEIYGWDDTIMDRELIESPIPIVEDDDYEPIPLYENDRWPKEKPAVNVFRANSSPKYQGDSKRVRSNFLSNETADRENATSVPRPKTTVQKKTNKRFTPSIVPSPIHGFSAEKRFVDKAENEETMILATDEEPIIQKVVPEPKEVQELPVLSNLTYSEVEEEEEEEEPVLVVNKEVIRELEMLKVEEVSVTERIEDIVDIEVENQIVLDIPELVEVEAPEEIIELETFQVEELEKEIEPVQLEIKEKVVPFNVLMLKSDKEKLAIIEQKKLQFEMNNLEKVNTVRESTELKFEQITLEEPRTKEIMVASELVRESATEVVEELEEETEELAHYVFPSLDLLIPPEIQIEDTEWLESQSEKLEESLSHFGVQANVIDAVQGPTVTRFELTVGQGTKVSRVRNLTDDLKLALAAEDIRIQAPIPGRSSIGIEIPNKKTRPVRISEVIGTEEFNNSESPLEAVLGLSLTGKPVTLDLRKMPHGMIAGATGSGKSVCINSILISLLYKASPTDLKMMLIDPKMVELAPFNGIPHLISPVITDVKAATAALKWAVAEMERRYELLAHAGVRDIERYNKQVVESRRFSLKMPYLLIVIDELSDLMMMAPADVEISISRISQKARACGIHLIIATQRPSVDVITGTIKANIPTRIAFAVSSQVDSRTIIDTAGADRLLGKGDMLYIGNGQSSAVRLQGTFVTDDEIERIIEHVQGEASPTYLFGQDDLLKSAVEEEETEPLFEDACFFIFEQGSASTSLLQRNFSIGYNRAAKLMDQIEKRGFISEQRGSRARTVLLTEADLEQLSET